MPKIRPSGKVLEGYLEGRQKLKIETSWESLTKREKEVLKLVGEGYSSVEIGKLIPHKATFKLGGCVILSKRGGDWMPTYMTLIRYTQQGMQSMKDSPTRLDTAEALHKSLGAEIESFYLAIAIKWRCRDP